MAMTTRSDVHPLSYGQRALWFLHRLAPDSTAYNFVVAARVFGASSVERLRAAVEDLVDRHATLRTVYELDGGVPVQRTLARGRVDFTMIELAAATTQEVRERLTEFAYRPFDLEHGPVFRAAVLTVAGGEPYLVMSAHHIAIDFRSIGLLLEDLGECHRARGGVRAAALPELTSQYVDYVRLQDDLIRSPAGQRLWDYWRQRLEGAPARTELPVDSPRPAVQSFHGATVTVEVDRSATEELKQVARASGVTVEATILSTLQLLLRDWTGQHDIVVGCPTPGRTPDFARVVGYFVNPVAVRTTFEADLRVVDLLADVHAAMTDAWEHQAFPFPLLVERLHPARDARYSPVFQVLFAMYDLEEERALPLLLGAESVRVLVGDIQLEPLTLDHRGAMLDLSLIAVNMSGRVTLFFQFNEDLFKRSTIERLAARFTRLLEDVARDPTRLISGTASRAAVAQRPAPVSPRGMDFSLFFFASDNEDAHEPAYRLLVEAARFADRRGFSAVWTPERHFHPFGGIYPNPAVTGAAVAAITEHIQIRAGSVVLPLHHPIRVAEEWSVVDNISNGRVAVSFASGWHANDFVFAPGNYETRRDVMAREIDTVRRLWRGEAVAYRAGDGRDAEVRIWPRPVQRELPIWVTAFGSPDTFRLAGELGAGVLTHLLGQSVADLSGKIELYREAMRRRGLDPSTGRVAVMLHAFVGDDDEEVRRIVRDPFIAYLRTSVDLARAGEQAGLVADGEHYRPANVDAFLQATFDRYYATNTLFGTPETCAALVERLQEIGVTEIACLIDFGVDVDRVLGGLEGLDTLREKFAAPPGDGAAAARVAVQRAVIGATERVQHRRQAIERQARVRLAAAARDGQAPKDGRR